MFLALEAEKPMKTLGFCHLRAVLRPKFNENLRFFNVFDAWSLSAKIPEPGAHNQEPTARIPQPGSHSQEPTARS